VGGPVGVNAHPVHLLKQGEPGVGFTQRLTQAPAAQGDVTLGPEQGEREADFGHLGGSIAEGFAANHFPTC